MWGKEQWNKQPGFLGSLGPTPQSLLGSTPSPKQEANILSPKDQAAKRIRGIPCPREGTVRRGKALSASPGPTASSPGMRPRPKPARWGLGCWWGGRTQCKVPLPLTGQQSWPRVQGRGRGPQAWVRAGWQFLKLGFARLHGISLWGVRANEGGVYNRRGCFSDSGGEKVDARREWCASTEQGVTNYRDPWPLGLDLSCD